MLSAWAHAEETFGVFSFFPCAGVHVFQAAEACESRGPPFAPGVCCGSVGAARFPVPPLSLSLAVGAAVGVSFGAAAAASSFIFFAAARSTHAHVSTALEVCRTLNELIPGLLFPHLGGRRCDITRIHVLLNHGDHVLVVALCLSQGRDWLISHVRLRRRHGAAGQHPVTSLTRHNSNGKLLSHDNDSNQIGHDNHDIEVLSSGQHGWTAAGQDLAHALAPRVLLI
jgi:hypothetical protein